MYHKCTCSFREAPPFTFSMNLDVGHKYVVFLRSPRSCPEPFPCTAWLPSHLSLSLV
ncbi:unnamed protein product [Musa banksii]